MGAFLGVKFITIFMKDIEEGTNAWFLLKIDTKNHLDELLGCGEVHLLDTVNEAFAALHVHL